MKLLFLGDVVGRSGREAVTNNIKGLRAQLGLNFVIVNAENSAGGFGLNEKIVSTMVNSQVDVITTGDHCFDKKETKFFINKYPQMIRAANFPSQLPGKGHEVYETAAGKKVLVIHLLCQLFMKYQVNCPFETVDRILKNYKLADNIDFIIVDFHGEATSEKMAMGHFLDGRVSLVTGSHTHVPTADVQILPNGTAYHTDAGMCGDYDSIIGFKKEIAITNFLNKIRGDQKMEPASNEATLCGTYAELNPENGLAINIQAFRMGGRLSEQIPS
jgi:metallophosphoesterase (TIGR00282 family)